jgi:hypothetical protein
MPKFELCQKVDKTSSFTTCTISNFGGTILIIVIYSRNGKTNKRNNNLGLGKIKMLNA